MKKLACITFSLIFGLAACTGQAPTATPFPVIPTLTPHPPTLTSTSTVTFRPGKSPSDLATQQARITKILQINDDDCGGFADVRGFYTSTSPDGLWRINYCLDPNTKFSYTKVIQVNGVTTWKVPFYETFISKLKSDTVPEGFKQGQIILQHWSGNGKYVYLSPYICCIDGPTLFNGRPALYQLDLDTGKLKDMLPSGGRIGFSLDDKYLVYRTLPATLHLLNLQTGQDTTFALDSKFVDIGVFSWSPDSQKLVFVAALEDWDTNMYDPTPVSKNGFSLLLLDLETMQVTILIDNDNRMFVPGSSSYYESDNAWADNDKMYLAQMDIAGRDESKTYLYDVRKRQLTFFSTPTPIPTP